MSVLVERVVTQPRPSNSSELTAHIARKGAVTEGYVTGRPVRGLCGLVLVPSRSPDGLPVCPECQSALAVTASRD